MQVIITSEEAEQILKDYIQTNYYYSDHITKVEWVYSKPDSIVFTILPETEDD